MIRAQSPARRSRPKPVDEVDVAEELADALYWQRSPQMDLSAFETPPTNGVYAVAEENHG